MRDADVVRLGKPIDNSRVVRQGEPRSRRALMLLILLVSVLAAAPYNSRRLLDVASRTAQSLMRLRKKPASPSRRR